MNITSLGIDIAKNTFFLCGLNRTGKVVFRQKVSRDKLLFKVMEINPQLIALEACSGSHHWARTFSKHGLKTKLIAPHYVKPYVKRDKTDSADAEAIAEAATRASMRFVPVKSEAQQKLQLNHKVRERLTKQKTSLSNEIRGVLGEYGVVIPQGFSAIHKVFRSELPSAVEGLLMELYSEFRQTEERLKYYDDKLRTFANSHPVAKRLMTIPGVAHVTATACIAAIGESSSFKNGREFASWIGLTPREHSTGGKQKLYGISKRGNKYLRKLLIHGARAVVYRAKNKEDVASNWINQLNKRAATNKTVVAYANKNARIIWSLISKEESVYSAELAFN